VALDQKKIPPDGDRFMFENNCLDKSEDEVDEDVEVDGELGELGTGGAPPPTPP